MHRKVKGFSPLSAGSVTKTIEAETAARSDIQVENCLKCCANRLHEECKYLHTAYFIKIYLSFQRKNGVGQTALANEDRKGSKIDQRRWR